MPTGYTAALEDGPVPFERFALQCARAFGACIDMREESNDAPIPERFEPRSYYSERIEKDRRELEALRTMSDETAAGIAHDELEGAMLRYEESVARLAAANARFREMLVKVEAWQPPTPDHQGLKDFMREQITISIHDYQPMRPEAKPLSVWKADRIKGLERNVEYYSEEQRKEIARTEARNQWLAALRESLTPVPA